MLPAIEQKLDNLVKMNTWDEILIKHEENGVSCVGIHEIYGHDNKDESGHLGISWVGDPLVVSDDIESLEKYLLSLLELVRGGLVVTEKELEQFNCCKFKKKDAK